MILKWANWTRSSRRLIFLSPSRLQQRLVRACSLDQDGTRHGRLLADAQRLRGRVYLADGAIRVSDLTGDGRHLQPTDDLSYHILTLDEKDNVLGCLRYLPHAYDVSMSDLALSHSAIARSSAWGAVVEEAIRTQVHSARRQGFTYIELGGWAMSEELRGGVDAVRMLLSVYALARSTGGALGITTATTRHHSSSILRRMGGKSLTVGGQVVPPYFDPQFGCEMELLGFNSNEPSAQYAELISDYQSGLAEVPVIQPDCMAGTRSSNRSKPILFNALPATLR